MTTADFDSNLKIESNIKCDDIVWFDAANFSPIKIYGALGGTNPYARMDLTVAKSINDAIYGLSKNCAGIRARFRTDSPYIAIKAKWGWLDYMPHMPLSGSSGFDLYSYENGKQEYVGAFLPTDNCEFGYESLREARGKMTDYILNFPHYNDVDVLYIGFKKGSNFETPSTYINDEKPVVYYGSSITQGGCSTRSGTTYQNFLSREFDINYLNFGFSGSGRGEDAMIEYLANLEMSVFVSDYDYNATTLEHLNETHYKLYKGIREKHPDIPYVIISKPNFLNAIDFNFNPVYKSIFNSARKSIIMETYKRALAEGDNNVYFVDGSMLFAGEEWDACTVDGTHPNDLGFYRMAQTLVPVFKMFF